MNTEQWNLRNFEEIVFTMSRLSKTICTIDFWREKNVIQTKIFHHRNVCIKTYNQMRRDGGKRGGQGDNLCITVGPPDFWTFRRFWTYGHNSQNAARSKNSSDSIVKNFYLKSEKNYHWVCIPKDRYLFQLLCLKC